MNKEELKIGDQVQRVRSSKFGPGISGLIGRRGEVAVIYDDQVRVHWTSEADGRPLDIRTWVNIDTVAKIVPGIDMAPALASAG